MADQEQQDTPNTDEEFEAAFDSFASAREGDPEAENAGKSAPAPESEGQRAEGEQGAGEQGSETGQDGGAEDGKEAAQGSGQEDEQARDQTGDERPEGVSPEVWDAATDAQKEEFRRLAQQASEADRRAKEADHRYRSNEGRVSALQRKINELQRAGGSGDPAPSVEQMKTALQTPEGWASFEEEYPDVANAVGEYLATAMAREREQLQQYVDERVTPLIEMEGERTAASQESALEQAHPDFREIAQSDSWNEWVQQQPETIQALATSDYADEVSRALDLFKHDTQTTAPHSQASTPVESRKSPLREKRKGQLADAETVQGSQAGTKPVAMEDFDSAFDYYASKRDQAMR